MTREEKAKAYDEAVKKAKKLYEQGTITESLNYVFPELRKSDDERIKKAQLDYWRSVGGKEWHGVPVQEVIAWLEKQGKQKQTIAIPKWKYKKDSTPLLQDSIILNKYGCVAKSPSGAIVSNVWILDYNELAKLPKEKLEQESIDKVEPKLKVGDWIVNNDSEDVFQVTEIKDDEYCLWPLDAEIMGYLRTIDVDNEYHLWTIADAKEGDVLAFDNDHIILVKESHNSTWGWRLSCWCHLLEGEFEVVEYHTKTEGVKPATKEQRDTLFTKMKESGYEWNEEKKELRKMEQKTKWSDDEQYLLICKNALRKYQVSDKWDAEIISKWLEDKLKQGEQKPKWSEEDESKVKEIIYFLDTAKVHYADTTALNDCIDWLMSLR